MDETGSFRVEVPVVKPLSDETLATIRALDFVTDIEYDGSTLSVTALTGSTPDLLTWRRREIYRLAGLKGVPRRVLYDGEPFPFDDEFVVCSDEEDCQRQLASFAARTHRPLDHLTLEPDTEPG
jgi:hypothetical protein